MQAIKIAGRYNLREPAADDAGSGPAHGWQRGRTLTNHRWPYAALQVFRTGTLPDQSRYFAMLLAN
jgi:hypothetical protein